MNKLWAFVSEPKNLAVMMALAGGLGFVFKEWVLPKPPSAPTTAATAPTPTQNAFSESGNAINASGGAQVQVTTMPPSAATSAAK